MDFKKVILFKKIKNHSKPLKLQEYITIFSTIYIAGKVAHAVRNSELFRIWSLKFKRKSVRCTDCFLAIGTAL